MVFWVCTADMLLDIFWLNLVFDVGTTSINVINVIGHEMVIVLFFELGENLDVFLTNVRSAALE